MEKQIAMTEEQPKHFDFISSICLFLIAVYIVFESIKISNEVGGPLYSSPGLLPLFLGSMLLLCSVLLFARSLKKTGISGNISTLKAWFAEVSKSKDTMNMLIGIVILGVFTFFLMPTFPFLISSFIFMVVLMKVLDAGSYWKVIIISACVSATVYTLFQIIFKVPLP